MRVLVVLKYIPSRFDDRKSDSIWSVVDGLAESGFDVVLATQGRKADTDFTVIHVSESGAVGFFFSFLRSAASFLNLNNLNKRIRDACTSHVVTSWVKRHGGFDAVISLCTANHPALIGYQVAKTLGVPFLVREHKIYERTINSLSDLPSDYLHALRGADVLFAVSPFLADKMISLGVRDDINVNPNSISDMFFYPPTVKPETFRNRCSWSDATFIYGGWTRWRDFKRLDLLLEAFRDVHTQRPDTRLLVAGSIEPDTNAVWVGSYLIEHGLEDVVFLCGTANRNQIHQIAHNVDCAVVPSDFETFGLPALEALAAGKPVVTTRCNGPEWLVRDERFGRCVDRGSSEALAEAMLEVYEARDSFDHEFIRSETWNAFSRTAVARQWADAIRKAVSEKG